MSQENGRNEVDLSFSEAMEELERILRGVEAEETDIDVLGEELQRAAELLELCRAKIRRAEVEVTQIVQSLEEGAVAAGDESESSAAADEVDDNEEELPF